MSIELDEDPQEQIYTVTWVCEIEANSPRQAAERALEMHRDPSSLAIAFEIVGEDGRESMIDLIEPETP